MRLTRVRWWLIAILLVSVQTAVGQNAPTDAAWSVEEEHWYVLEIGGVRTGWQSVKLETNGVHWRSTSASEMTISRGAATASIASNSVMVETTDGEPVSMRFEQNMASQASVTRWEFEDGAVRQIVASNGRDIVKTLDYPDKPWTTPIVANDYWLKKVAEGAETIFTRVLMPDNGLTPAEVVYKRIGRENAVYRGETVEATRWTTSTSLMPGISATELYAPDGVLIRSEADLPFGLVITQLSTRQLAQADPGVGPEIMLSSFVPLKNPIQRVMRSTSATYRLRTIDGRDMDLPDAGAQRVERDGGEYTVTVDLANAIAATEEEQADQAYLEASGVVDCEDSLIVKLASNAVRRAGDDVAAKAEALRTLAYRHISRKGMATAFASASETARTRTGDCSEHAVLLAALLRAEGIPARIATGLVYVDRFEGQRNVFGWHMWTQAMIDGKWIDLDATLPVAYHAGHVLTGVSAMSDDQSSAELNSIVTIIGNLEIEVIDVGYE